MRLFTLFMLIFSPVVGYSQQQNVSSAFATSEHLTQSGCNVGAYQSGGYHIGRYGTVPSNIYYETELPNLPAATTDKRVFVFTGVACYWPNMTAFNNKLRCRGYQPIPACSLFVPTISKSLIRQKQNTGACGPVNLVGYSLGATNSVKLARTLGESGIEVDHLILIEPFDHPVIPGNVRHCLNIYESRPTDRLNIFEGTAATAESPQTALHNLNISNSTEWAALRVNNHFTIATDPRVQRFLASQLPMLDQTSETCSIQR